MAGAGGADHRVSAANAATTRVDTLSESQSYMYITRVKTGVSNVS